MAQFSLSWDAYKQNICGGLSALQQSGEFVDMTLAADGHHVKVHQMVMALVSPYIKELITAASCPHPVIFLTKISYTTLCAILEYVYTGEVLITKENLSELIEAGRDLRIKGLEDMKLELSKHPQLSQTMQTIHNEGQPLSETGYFNKTQSSTGTGDTVPQFKITKSSGNREAMAEVTILSHKSNEDATFQDSHFADDDDIIMEQNDSHSSINVKIDSNKGLESQIQYTTSCQGSLQMILNRFIYNLRYTSRKESNGHRQWRCTEYGKKLKCPATVITRNDVVVKRMGAHTHPFHDNRILKKVRDNMVYSAVTDAEQVAVKKGKAQPNKPVANKDGGTTTDAE